MKRFVRFILCLLMFSLLINAGGIASANTYPSLHLDNQQQSGTPLKKPQRPQRGNISSSDPVGYAQLAGLFLQVARPGACQYCTKMTDEPYRAARSPRFPSIAISFVQLYPDTLSPPPRLIARV